MGIESLGVYEALKKLFVTDKDGHIIVDSFGAGLTVDISDDWTRQLGLVDLSRVLGATLAHTNPVIVRISDGTSAYLNPQTIRALTSADIITAYGSQTQALQQKATTYELITDPADRAARLLGITYGNLGQLDQRLVSTRNLLTVDVSSWNGAGGNVNANPVRVGGTQGTAFSQAVGGALDVGPTNWGGTALTGRDISGDLSNLDVALSTKARLQPWYQTNFATVGKNYVGSAVAPHASATRWTYTVPASRIAIVKSCYCFLMRDGAPGTAALASCQIGATLSGTAVIVLAAEQNTATLSVAVVAYLGDSVVLKAGDVLEGYTFDLSTTGTYRYRVTATLIEFDT
jgi:hypothetical protein